jgi:hypothetical protein
MASGNGPPPNRMMMQFNRPPNMINPRMANIPANVRMSQAGQPMQPGNNVVVGLPQGQNQFNPGGVMTRLGGPPGGGPGGAVNLPPRYAQAKMDGTPLGGTVVQVSQQQGGPQVNISILLRTSSQYQ